MQGRHKISRKRKHSPLLQTHNLAKFSEKLHEIKEIWFFESATVMFRIKKNWKKKQGNAARL